MRWITERKRWENRETENYEKIDWKEEIKNNGVRNESESENGWIWKDEKSMEGKCE